MRNYLILLVLTLVAVGCDEQRQTDELIYTRSTKTGLCFAWGGAGNAMVMTNVPCGALGGEALKEQK